MNNFTFYSPTQFVFGKDTEKEVGTLTKQYGGKKVMQRRAVCATV